MGWVWRAEQSGRGVWEAGVPSNPKKLDVVLEKSSILGLEVGVGNSGRKQTCNTYEVFVSDLELSKRRTSSWAVSDDGRWAEHACWARLMEGLVASGPARKGRAVGQVWPVHTWWG